MKPRLGEPACVVIAIRETRRNGNGSNGKRTGGFPDDGCRTQRGNRFLRREVRDCIDVVEEGTSYRDRVLAVRRLSKLGFRVSFTEDGPRPGALK